MQKILITGAAGFIGSNLAMFLTNIPDIEVTIIDDLSTGQFSNLDGIQYRKFYQYHISKEDTKLLHVLVNSCDIIVHLAASVGVQNVIENCYETITNNIESTQVILEACKLYRKRCLIASTSEVYGKNISELHESDDIILGSTYKNRWSYAVSKLVDEFLALDLYNKYQLSVTILRFFNISGYNQSGRYGMVIPRFIEQALSNNPITIFGDGSQARCFTHIKNVTEIIYKLIDNEKSYGKIINIGNPEETSILELANYIKNITKSKSELIFNAEKNIYNNNFEDMQRRFPNISTLENILDFKVSWLSYKEIVKDILMSKGFDVWSQ